MINTQLAKVSSVFETKIPSAFSSAGFRCERQTQTAWVLRHVASDVFLRRAVVVAHGEAVAGQAFRVLNLSPSIAFFAPEGCVLLSSLSHMLDHGDAFQRFDLTAPGELASDYALQPVDLDVLFSGVSGRFIDFDIIVLKPGVNANMSSLLSELGQCDCYDHVDWHICRDASEQTAGAHIPAQGLLEERRQVDLMSFGTALDGIPVLTDTDTGDVTSPPSYFGDPLDSVGVFWDTNTSHNWSYSHHMRKRGE